MLPIRLVLLYWSVLRGGEISVAEAPPAAQLARASSNYPRTRRMFHSQYALRVSFSDITMYLE
jgi:hypothetical protein